MSARPSAAGPGERPEDAAARLTGCPVGAGRPLSGSLTEAVLGGGAVSGSDAASGGGTAVMVKRGDGPGAARAEAAGLRWLAAAGALPVPAVRGQDSRWLVTERIATGRPTAEAAARFGRGLAAVHAAGAPAFGSAPPGGPEEAYIGSAPMRNAVGAAWPRWYAEHRVLPYLRRAVDAGAVRREEAGAVERVCNRLPDLAGPDEPPARLHGDLWSGNVVWGADGRGWLIDPAAHGGHRETDLAMLRLFGCPYLERVLGSYREVAPLADGWVERVALHQLFPLLVHAVLFGRGYGEQAVTAARTALSP